MMLERKMSKEKKMLFGGALAIAIVLGVVLFVGMSSQEVPQNETPGSEISDELVVYFSEEMWKQGVENQGGAMPIEGFDAQLYLGAFPGLVEEDFDGVEAINGKWILDDELRFVSDTGYLVTSADGTINEEGMRTLLSKLSLRLGVEVDSEEDVDKIIQLISVREITGEKVDFKELNKGLYSEILQREIRVLKSSQEWANLWNEMFPTEMIVPVLDDDRMIVAVFMGEQNTGGYSTEITEIRETDDGMVFFVEETFPGENCAVTLAMTSPFYIVELEKSDKQVEFVYSRDVMEC